MNETTEITEEELLTALDTLHKKKNDLKPRINSLEQLKLQPKNKMTTNYQETTFIKKSEEDNFLEEEINFYYENLKGCTTEEEINQVLPLNTNPNYINILLVLKLKVLRDIRSINELIGESNDLSIEDLDLIKQEINQEQIKIEQIDSCISPSNHKISRRMVKVK